MKRMDSFLTVNVLIVGFLAYTYFYASVKLDYFERNPVLKAKYERSKELKELQRELQQAELKSRTTTREVASVHFEGEGTLVGHSPLDQNELARRFFSQVQLNCFTPEVQIKCVESIDTIVTQFPESIWAGESLLVLTDLYRKNSRDRQALQLIQILKAEFKQFASIQAKVEYLEKQPL